MPFRLAEQPRHADVRQDHHAVRAAEDAALVGQLVVLVVGSSSESMARAWMSRGRALLSVVPRDLHGLSFGEGRAGKDVVADGVGGPGMVVRRGAFAAHAERRGERERLEDGVVNVAAHVAESARAEIEPLAPIARMIPALADERALGADAEPKVPVEALGNRVGAHRAARPRRPTPCCSRYALP